MSNFYERYKSYETPDLFAEKNDYIEAEAIYEIITGIKPIKPYYPNHGEKTSRIILAIAGVLHNSKQNGKEQEKQRIGEAFADFIRKL